MSIHFVYIIAQDSKIERLQLIENRCMIFILNKMIAVAVSEIIIKLKLIRMKLIMCYHTMKIIFGIRDIAPKYLANNI